MNERKKKGLISLLVAVICFGIGVFVVGGAIGGILLLGAIVALIVGSIYLVQGFTGKG